MGKEAKEKVAWFKGITSLVGATTLTPKLPPPSPPLLALPSIPCSPPPPPSFT